MYEQEVEVDQQVFKNIKIFKGPPKAPDDDLFDRLTVRILTLRSSDDWIQLTCLIQLRLLD
jgi:DNA topoisomerase IB